VQPPLDTPVSAGMQVEVKHARSIAIVVGASREVFYTQHKVLRDALAEAGYSLRDDDRVVPGLDAEVTNGMTARLVRVTGRSVVEKSTVARKTVFKPDESLSGTATRIAQGQDGVNFREYRIVIEDGVEKEKTLVRQWSEPEVRDTVIYYPASTIRATGLAADSFSVTSTKRMYATWYNAASSGKPATDRGYGITASGVAVTRGIVAVDPAVIPLGTRLYIPGYGFAVAGDTGGGIIGDRIDLGFADGQPIDWQTGWTEVYVLAY
jgi:3D (Asp-Asp-Asp) domain-containing protein